MTVTPITSFEQFKTIVNGSKPVVIDFWATWCGPCKVISPIFQKFSDLAEFSGIDFYKVDVDEQEQISHEVGVRAMPTFVAFKSGEKAGEVVGAIPVKLQQLLLQVAKSG